MPPPYAVPALLRNDANHYTVDVSIEDLANRATAHADNPSDSEDTEDFVPASAAHHHVHRNAPIITPKKPNTAPSASRKQKSRARYRKKRREARKLEQDLLDSSVKRCTVAAYAVANILKTHYEIQGHGYQGQRDRKILDEYSLIELLELLGFRLIEWNGCDPVKILDSRRRLLVFLAGRPKERWDGVEKDLWAAFSAAYKEIQALIEEEHRRGGYGAVGAGVSLGNGSIAPGNLRLKPWEARVVEKLRKLPALKRIVGFVNRAFEAALPKLHALYSRVLSLIIARNPRLQRNFENSVFGGAHFNLGPVTVTRRHRDHLNYILGPCPTTACGPFDYKLGGHLVLWELGLVIEFPPGSTIFFPSALLEHSNVPIQPGEQRGSFTQYTAAGLIHWVDNGFKLNSTIHEHGSAVEKVGVVRRRETAFARALKLLPIVEDVD